MKLIIQLLIISCLFLSCHQVKENKWKKLECGLFINSIGEIGFPSELEIATIPDSLLEPEQCPNTFITHLAFDSTLLHKVIDTSTFAKLGATFYKDKNNIYFHYMMCDGGYLSLFKKNINKFQVLGDCYAKDSKTIYYRTSAEIENVDYNSFTSKKGWGAFAKDKNNYYALGSVIPKGDYQFYKLDTLK